MPVRKCAECGEVHLAGANGAVFCVGPILRAVQMSNLFKDSKHFVDMSARYSPERILADWQLFSSCKRNETSIKHLTNFVDNHFDAPGTELEYWCPPDWRYEPAFLCQVKDPQLRKFAVDLNLIWKQLGRHIKDNVRTNPLMYSLVYMPNPLIVPGGRFAEYNYWDTYWIVRGLLFSGMHQTARGIIDNLLYLVQEYKFVPQGGRIYYWGRSQPPLLVPMVKSYVEITGDDSYVQKALPFLQTEMDIFLKDHSVQVQGRTMYQYRDKSPGPRPEAYREDIQSASSYTSEEEKEEHYSNLKAACESGMDFSSRWFVSPNGDNVGTLEYIKTTWIVPVDLNCILFRNCKTLAEFNVMTGNAAKADHYRHIAGSLIKAITAVLWNKERGVWFDYDLRNKKLRDYFVVSNLSPLWARAYPINDANQISESVMSYIEENKLDTYPGGVPHTLNNTGQQWDYPNVWAPMMHILIEGLNNLGTPAAKEMSQRWRERWVRANYNGFTNTGFMFEKYNCEEAGAPGSGGAFIAQTGYGWTNGVLLELLARYGQELTASDDVAIESTCSESCTDICNVPEDASLMEDDIITSDAYLAQNNEAMAEGCSCITDAVTPTAPSNQQMSRQIHEDPCSCDLTRTPVAQSKHSPDERDAQNIACACSCEMYDEQKTPTVATSEISSKQTQTNSPSKVARSGPTDKAAQFGPGAPGDKSAQCAENAQTAKSAPCAQSTQGTQSALCAQSALTTKSAKSTPTDKTAQCAQCTQDERYAWQNTDDGKSALCAQSALTTKSAKSTATHKTAQCAQSTQGEISARHNTDDAKSALCAQSTLTTKSGKSSPTEKAGQCEACAQSVRGTPSNNCAQSTPTNNSGKSTPSIKTGQCCQSALSDKPVQCGQTVPTPKSAQCAQSPSDKTPKRTADGTKGEKYEEDFQREEGVYKPKLFPLVSAEMCAKKPNTGATKLSATASEQARQQLLCHCQSDLDQDGKDCMGAEGFVDEFCSQAFADAGCSQDDFAQEDCAQDDSSQECTEETCANLNPSQNYNIQKERAPQNCTQKNSKQEYCIQKNSKQENCIQKKSPQKESTEENCTDDNCIYKKSPQDCKQEESTQVDCTHLDKKQVGKTQHKEQEKPNTSCCNSQPPSTIMMKLFPLGDDSDPVKKPPKTEEEAKDGCECKKPKEVAASKNGKEVKECN